MRSRIAGDANTALALAVGRPALANSVDGAWSTAHRYRFRRSKRRTIRGRGEARLTAKGWIAIGDRARGLLLAIGNTAVAPIAIGTMSCGIMSFGVVSIGVVSFGVVSIAALSLGVLAIGGWSVGAAVAVGYLAAAPAAFGWEAAHGAVAIAFHYADGAKAIAEHASEEVAKEYFANSRFFQRASGALEWVAARASYFRWSVALMPPALLCAFRLAYRRKTQGRATDQ